MSDRELSIIIETDAYAGNFERELTAYCTGTIGDCEIGDEEAIDFINKYKYTLGGYFSGIENKKDYIGSTEVDYVELVEQRITDEYGTYRPCTIRKNSLGANNNVEIFLYYKPSIKHFNIIKDRVESFISKRDDIKLLGIKVVEKKTVVTEIELEV